LVHPFEQIFELVESALPEAGHPACPVDQRGQGAELRAVARLAAFVAGCETPARAVRAATVCSPSRHNRSKIARLVGSASVLKSTS
jgi:hypothetical protein